MNRLSRQQIVVQEMSEIGAEHRELFALCWQFYKELRTGCNPGYLIDVFDDIVKQARGHFAHEETVLKKIAFPRHAAHKLAHHEILVDLMASQHALRAVNEMTHRDTQHSLDALLIHHVKENARFPGILGS
jgi:hemerythrin-like metal-binding protein